MTNAQLEMGLKNTDEYLCNHGYYLGKDHHNIMTPRIEARFGQLMIEAATADGLFNPYKNKPSEVQGKKLSSGDIALNLAWGSGVTTSALVKATGLGTKSASNVLSNLARFNYLVVDKSRTVRRSLTWVLTKKGRDKVERLCATKKGSGQRKSKVTHKNAMSRDVMLKLAVLGVTSRQLAEASDSSNQKASRYLRDQTQSGYIKVIGKTVGKHRGANIYGLTDSGEHLLDGLGE